MLIDGLVASPQLVELAVPVTEPMATIYHAVAELLDACIRWVHAAGEVCYKLKFESPKGRSSTSAF